MEYVFYRGSVNLTDRHFFPATVHLVVRVSDQSDEDDQQGDDATDHDGITEFPGGGVSFQHLALEGDHVEFFIRDELPIRSCVLRRASEERLWYRMTICWAAPFV